MEIAAYIMMTIGLFLFTYNSARNKSGERGVGSMLLTHLVVVLFFLLGAIFYGFVENNGVLMMLCVIMTALASIMLGMALAISAEENDQTISKGLAKKRVRNNV